MAFQAWGLALAISVVSLVTTVGEATPSVHGPEAGSIALQALEVPGSASTVTGLAKFKADPMRPMPRRLMSPFGRPVNYQPGGMHTGIDLRGSLIGGQEPPLYAVGDGTVAHVGPLYCIGAGVCRGDHAIILDHGGQVYSIYSHNSEATVTPGQRVVAGQMIGRQGNEGYSRRSHLHLEVHVGAPYSGDWTKPWAGGEFIDPLPLLPTSTLSSRWSRTRR